MATTVTAFGPWLWGRGHRDRVARQSFRWAGAHGPAHGSPSRSSTSPARGVPDRGFRSEGCSRGSPTGRGGWSSWRRKRPGCSTTTRSAPSTSCSASFMKARVSRPGRSARWASAWTRRGRRSRRSSAAARRRPPGISRSHRGPRRCSSSRYARHFSLGSDYIGTSTSCSPCSRGRRRRRPDPGPRRREASARSGRRSSSCCTARVNGTAPAATVSASRFASARLTVSTPPTTDELVHRLTSFAARLDVIEQRLRASPAD